MSNTICCNVFTISKVLTIIEVLCGFLVGIRCVHRGLHIHGEMEILIGITIFVLILFLELYAIIGKNYVVTIFTCVFRCLQCFGALGIVLIFLIPTLTNTTKKLLGSTG